MEITALFMFLLSLSTCIANDGPIDTVERFNNAIFHRWRSTFADSEAEPNFHKMRDGEYFLNRERNIENSGEFFQPDEGTNFEEYITDHELESSIPYGIQNVRDVALRSTIPQTQTIRFDTKFQPLCPHRRQTIFLNLDSDFEYRPDHFEEVTCSHPYTSIREYNKENNKICGKSGFTCIQLNRTIFLTRRAYGTDCWESVSRIVAAGCECMWPQHGLGDIFHSTENINN